MFGIGIDVQGLQLEWEMAQDVHKRSFQMKIGKKFLYIPWHMGNIRYKV